MTAVGIAIADVVDDVHGARENAEDRKRGHGGENRSGFEEAAAEQQSGEQEEIFSPLLGAKRRREQRRGRAPDLAT